MRLEGEAGGCGRTPFCSLLKSMTILVFERGPASDLLIPGCFSDVMVWLWYGVVCVQTSEVFFTPDSGYENTVGLSVAGECRKAGYAVLEY